MLEAQLEYCFLPIEETGVRKGLRPPLNFVSVAPIKYGVESPS